MHDGGTATARRYTEISITSVLDAIDAMQNGSVDAAWGVLLSGCKALVPLSEGDVVSEDFVAASIAAALAFVVVTHKDEPTQLLRCMIDDVVRVAEKESHVDEEPLLLPMKPLYFDTWKAVDVSSNIISLAQSLSTKEDLDRLAATQPNVIIMLTDIMGDGDA